MNQLFIIGNGFDLAHGLPTRYQDFLLHFIKEATYKWFKQGSYLDANFSFGSNAPRSEEEIKAFTNSFQSFKVNLLDKGQVSFQNPLLKAIFQKLPNNWVDIEYIYFELMRIVIQRPNQSTADKRNEIFAINQGLNNIKLALEEYLKLVVLPLIKNIGPIDKFKRVFVSTPGKISIFLNFNYTPTINKYLEGPGIELINIHGEILNPDNPVIFGFGDDYFEEYDHFENFNDNCILENIKTLQYPMTKNYQRLKEFLNLNIGITGIKERFDVNVIGHSCGISDRALLKRIFEIESCSKIKYYHFPDRNDFRQRIMEISRHFNDNGDLNDKLIPFDPANRCPQITD